MHFHGAYNRDQALVGMGNDGSWALAPWAGRALPKAASAWACSLFAAMGGDTSLVFGRNFDWDHSPALLLFTNPPDGYASVSMVDIGYLVDEDDASDLISLPLGERTPLLETPYWPFDGMNEHGLIIGMAAVPGSPLPHASNRQTIDSLMAIRLMLDLARNVDEAVEILGSHNVRWGGGLPLHYLIADASGQAALVEYINGEMVVLLSEEPYLVATNHLRGALGAQDNSGCWRYDYLAEELSRSRGDVNASEAMAFLHGVSQPNTQWSVVYSASGLRVDVVTGRRYDTVHAFGFRLAEPGYSGSSR